MFVLPDHPEIECCMRTGYPSWNQPKDIRCDHCGQFVDDEVYEDEMYECLCLDCLLKLHLKDEVEN
jgi:hypothetical protein